MPRCILVLVHFEQPNDGIFRAIWRGGVMSHTLLFIAQYDGFTSPGVKAMVEGEPPCQIGLGHGTVSGQHGC